MAWLYRQGLSKPTGAHFTTPHATDAWHGAIGFSSYTGLSCWVLVLLRSDSTLIFSCFSLLEWECLLWALVDWKYILFLESLESLSLEFWTLLELVRVWGLLEMDWIHFTLWNWHGLWEGSSGMVGFMGMCLGVKLTRSGFVMDNLDWIEKHPGD
jgi:hypothetical protein